MLLLPIFVTADGSPMLCDKKILGLNWSYQGLTFVSDAGVLSSDREVAFQQLKSALITAPALTLPDFSQPFTLETDASGLGFGVVSMQHNHPIAYLSKVVYAKNRAMPTYEKECLAILLTVDKWRAYLQNQEFTIRTNCRSLAHLSYQRVATKIQLKAILKLMDLQYKVVYKQGISNQAVDALS